MDFLVKNKINIYYSIKRIKLRNIYIPLESDIHISSIARLNKTVQLKPQTAYIIEAKLKQNPYFDNGMECILDKTTQGYLYDEPEIIVSATLSRSKKGKFPVQIINHSNKYVTLRRGCVLGNVTPVTKKNWYSFSKYT